MPLSPFFSKLLVSEQIKFEGGVFSLFGQRVILLPVEVLSELVKLSLDNPKMASVIYNFSKKAVHDGFATAMEKKGMKGRKLVELLLEIAGTSGWGKFELLNYNSETGDVKMNLYNSAVASNLHAKKPVDHIIRGGMAGVATKAFNMNVDFVEMSCLAMGKASCQFIAKSQEEWVKVKDKNVKEQLGL